MRGISHRQAIIRRRSITQLHKSIELTSQLVPNTSKNNSYKIPEKIRGGEKEIVIKIFTCNHPTSWHVPQNGSRFNFGGNFSAIVGI